MVYLLAIILISNVAFFVSWYKLYTVYDYITVYYTCIYCVITYYLNSINFQTHNNQHNVVMTAPFPPPFPNALITRNLFTRAKSNSS